MAATRDRRAVPKPGIAAPAATANPLGSLFRGSCRRSRLRVPPPGNALRSPPGMVHLSPTNRQRRSSIMQTHYKHWLLASMLLLLVLLLPLGPSYAEAPEPRFALHPVEKDGLYGYANDAGELVIPHQWQYAGQFRGAGYAAVESGRGKWAIITTGKFSVLRRATSLSNA